MRIDQAGATATEARVPVGDAMLPGDLVLLEEAEGIVLFAHGRRLQSA
jgi:hypothetical protein